MRPSSRHVRLSPRLRWLLPLAATFALIACGGGSSDPPPPPVADGGSSPTPDAPPTANQGKSGPKALVVEIDGLTFSALREALATQRVPALAGMQIAPAWTGGANGTLTAQAATDGPGWATLLTGTWTDRHGVQWDTADQRIDAAKAPSIFSLAKRQTAAGYRTAAVTAHPLYGQLLADDVAQKAIDTAVDCAGADACVTARTAAFIEEGYDLLVAQYGAPATAVQAGGLGGAAYPQAIGQTAAAVGELIAQIERRRAVDPGEDWLVLVTTGHGLDAFGSATGLQTIENKTIFIASNKALAALPGVGTDAPADDSLLGLAAATDIAPTVLRHLGALPPTTGGDLFDGLALQSTTSIRELRASTGAEKTSIVLSWSLAGERNAPVQMLRDGQLIATLAAGATTFEDPIEAPSNGIYTYRYVVASGDAAVALTARLAYVKPVMLAPTLRDGLVAYFPLDALPPLDARGASTLAPLAADADGGTLVDDDSFKAPYKAKALRVDSRVKNAGGMAGHRLRQTGSDVTTDPAVSAFTIGFWLRTDPTCSQGVSNAGNILSNKNYDTGANAGLEISVWANCEVRFNAGTGSARVDANGFSLSAGQWAYLALVIDKAGLRMDSYLLDPVRGVQSRSVALTAAYLDKLGGLGNGLSLNEDGTGLYYQRYDGASPRGAMDFDDLAIWNRALSSDEITSMFQAARPLSSLQP
jgi:hypothetical protein